MKAIPTVKSHLITTFIILLGIVLVFILTVFTNQNDSALIFVDSSLAHLDLLQADLQGQGMMVYLLATDRDGVTQISEVLNQKHGVTSLHLITHGNPGVIYLGNTRLDVSCSESYRQQLKSWTDHLRVDAPILVYGCEVANSNEGLDLIHKIKEYTGREVASSINLTGNNSLRGDWCLEYRTSMFEPPQLFSPEFQSSYRYTLGKMLVTNPQDTVAGSLREVLGLASPGDTIFFSFINDTIRLSAGPLFIEKPIVIQGPGADLLSLSAENRSNILDIMEGIGPVEISGLSINNGQVKYSNGGAINNAGNLILIKCTISDNQAHGSHGDLAGGGYGGAIYNSGQLILNSCAVINNLARGGDGAAPDTTGFGGSSGGGGGGGGGFGGAIFNQGTGTATIINSTISGNMARGGNGGPAFLVSGNIGGDGANGGGSGGTGGSMTANISGNSGGFGGGGGGGGGDSSGVAGSGGTGGFGGGGGGGGAGVSSGIGGSGGQGGGGAGGAATNLGAAGGGGGSGIGGAIFNNGGNIFIRNSTISDNQTLGGEGGLSIIGTGDGSPGSGISGGIYKISGIIDVQNSIIAANVGSIDVDVYGSFASSGYNLVGIVTVNSDGLGTGAGDVVGSTLVPLDPRLAPLGKYGGPTLTHALRAGSPAVDNGLNSADPPADQRGEPRQVDGNRDNLEIVDIGAYEARPPYEPSGLYAIVGNARVELRWNPNKELNIAYYRIYSDTTGAAAQLVGQVPVISRTDTVYNHVGLKNGTLYYYCITAVDSLGFESYYSTIITAKPNAAPFFTSLRDTTIFTYTNFIHRIETSDPEGDAVKFKDNSPLFEIDSLSGIIQFRPVLADTGKHIIPVSVADFISATTDSFLLNIIPNPVAVAESLTIIPQDQALDLRWYNPADVYYKGTIISISDAPITTVNPGIVVHDTIVTISAANTHRIRNLEIAKKYYIALLNYFAEDTVRIYSSVVMGMAETLAPLTEIDFNAREYTVVVNTRLDTAIVLKNSGGGTLLAQFRYQPDLIQSVWFEMDSTQQKVLPGDSINVAVVLHPTMATPDQAHGIEVTLYTNQPRWIPARLTCKLIPVFDHFAPQVQIKVRPNPIIKQGAVLFSYDANDTASAPIGDPGDQLWSRYLCTDLNSGQIFSARDSMHTGPVILYPLKDSRYEFKLWVYDNHDNGTDLPVYSQEFEVDASRYKFPSQHWFLLSFPRDTTMFWAGSDSIGGILRWDQIKEKYLSVNNTNLQAGFGYWMISKLLTEVDLRSIDVSDTQETVSIPILPGWNQIGIPLIFQIGWRDSKMIATENSITTEKSLVEAAKPGGWINPAIYWYNSESRLQGYEWGTVDTSLGIPWHGYWLYSYIEGTLLFPQQPTFSEVTTVVNKPQTQISRDDNNLKWEGNLSLSTEHYADSKNIFGLADQAVQLFEPPPIGDYAALYFKLLQEKLTGEYQPPFSNSTEIKKWQVMIESTVPEQKHHLQWNLPQGLDLYFYLVDHKNAVVIDMNTENTYDLIPKTKLTSFSLYATMDAQFRPKLIPNDFILAQNYPNPFNPQTTIRFGIPEKSAGRTVLKIYNILGQEVITLLDAILEPGYFEQVWNGCDAEHKQVASGIYFYTLKNSSQNLVRKMILIR